MTRGLIGWSMGFVVAAGLVAAGVLGVAGAQEKVAFVQEKARSEVRIAELAFDDAKRARVQGRLVGPDKHEYTFDARKGQKVKLSLSSELSPWIGMDLLAPVFAPTVKDSPAVYSNFIDGTTSWEGVAPGNGTYTVRLVLLRSQAKQIGKVDYELDVDLK